MQKSIRIRVIPVDSVLEELKKLLEKEYDLVPETVEKLVEIEVRPFMDHLRKDLYAVIEYPYVDKLYRDSYYIFYSSKHTHHHRNSVRISFFSNELEEAEFLDKKIYEEKLLKNYLGYLVLRPTFPKVIGRTAISPVALSRRNFACCVAPFSATTLSDKFKIHTFPHSSQDSHTITCAETTIWGIMEYFSSKYPEYKPVLPSHINKIIQKISFKRTFPSEGLTAEQVTYAIRELGFGAMIYSRKKHKHIFNTLVSIYIESGIPVIGVLKDFNGGIGHAVNIIGREIPDASAVAVAAHHENTEQGG
ncbi:hypothetical protein [Flavihumibacter sp. UBA7668]|uniref:hypothetical protein n=1 Tax=Flavihumibacter sp. UBA7668 TaxID=1946542 RepID=UPI0025BE99D7|nr:hypothetical protein [Flavihumibacter sp. UBA7668]